MNMDLENYNFIKEVSTLKNELETNKNIDAIKKDIEKISINIVDKFANYAIKAMPFPDGVKDILFDVKKVFLKKDFKKLVSTLITSSIREGLETIGAPAIIIKDIKKMTEIIKKGGFISGLASSVEIIANKYMKNNILGDYVKTFFDKVKEGVKSKDFLTNLDKKIFQINEKSDIFSEQCVKWYEAYNKMDVENINKIAKNLLKSSNIKGLDLKTKAENNIIQNMTKLVNNKNEKLSKEQLQLCQNI